MIRVRFAPNLSGLLFVTGARIALANYLFARRAHGRFTLRLDDLEEPRSRSDHAEQVMRDLGWLGLDWHTTLRQSERRDLYQEAIRRLREDGRLYPCFESETELKAKREFRRKRNQSMVYDRAMLSLTDRQREAAEAGGKRPYWRMRLSDRTLAWRDLILGERQAALPALSDPILVRADGAPTPLLASVVDDIASETTHVIRGEDNVTNTAIQIELFEALTGAQAEIRFGHLPPLEQSASPPDRPTSAYGSATPAGPKRRAPPLSLRTLRNDGVEPCALVASMVNVTSDRGDALPLEQLADCFEFASLATARFDLKQLLAINRRALQGMEFAAVADRLPGGATETFWLAVRGSMDLLREARGWWDVVAGTIVPPVVEGERDLLTAAAALLPPEPWDNAVCARWMSVLEHATGRSDQALRAPLLLALTGEDTGPDLADLLPLIGRTRAATRLGLAAP